MRAAPQEPRHSGREPAASRGFAGWSAARRVVRGPFRRLVAGQCLGQAGDGFAQLAFAQLVLFDIGPGATPGRIALVLAVTLLPFSVVGSVAGVVIDRWDRRRVLVLASRARIAVVALGILAIPVHSEILAFTAILLLLSTSRFVLAAKGAALPRTVDPRDLVTANAMSSVAGLVAAFLGAVAGAVLAERVTAAGFVVAGLTYGIAAAVFAALPPVGGGATEETLTSGLRRAATEVGDGIRRIASDAALRTPLTLVWAHRLLLGAGFVLLVLVADSEYRFEASGYGVALAVTGGAALLGSLSAPRLARRRGSSTVLAASFAPPALAALFAAYSPGLVTLVVAVAVAAFSFQVLKVTADALVGRASPDIYRGRVFAAYDVVYNVAFVLAALLMVPLWAPGDVRGLLGALGIAFAGAGLAAHAVLRRRIRAPGEGGRVWPGALAAFVAGAAASLVFAPAPLWWLAWMALVPWITLVLRASTGGAGLLRTWLGACGFLLGVHSWLLPVTGVFLLPVTAVMALLWLPWGIVLRRLLCGPVRPRGVLAAAGLGASAWVAAEFVRSWEVLGGPWGLLGASQAGRPAMLAPAALGGVWLVSALVVVCNTGLSALLTRATEPARWTAAALALAAFLAGPLFDAARPQPVGTGTLRVAIVQPGNVQGESARFAEGGRLTRLTVSDAPDLVVWGESSVGFDLDERPDALRRLTRLSAEVGAPILVNVDARRPGGGGIFKSSVLVGSRGVLGTYDKSRLVPFGEYIPARPVLGWIGDVTEAAEEDRRRGTGALVFEEAPVRLGPMVRFESAFPDMARALARRGADVIVVQSATTTFQESWAPDQHADLASVRAVETGVPVVHATLSGVSTAASPDGALLDRLGTGETGVLVVDVPLGPGSTPYMWAGDWVPALALITLTVAAGTRLANRRRRTRRLGTSRPVYGT